MSGNGTIQPMRASVNQLLSSVDMRSDAADAIEKPK
jgi:hypothetical protein